MIISKYGEPEEKTGGNVVNITIIYNRLGLEISFLSKTWEVNNAEIDHIVLFKHKTGAIICGVCRKPADMKCSVCKLIYYCGVACQRVHWPAHKKYCL
jgi:hypothetical protein